MHGLNADSLHVLNLGFLYRIRWSNNNSNSGCYLLLMLWFCNCVSYWDTKYLHSVSQYCRSAQ